MNTHRIHKGVCTQCGCDSYAIEYFGWACNGRSIQHQYKNDTCTNCGFCRDVIEHFGWPCRLDYRAGHAEEESRQPHDRRTEHDHHSERDPDAFAQTWHYPTDEIRYARLLGLRGKVTKWDIKCAYREQASLYHPDKVAHLAPDIQNMATEKMKEINRAFAYFQHKYGV
jgi:DnaJ domain